jgi:hypothetical protein
MPDKVSTWYGRSIHELTREELIEVVEFLAKENSEQREESIRRLDFMSQLRNNHAPQS